MQLQTSGKPSFSTAMSSLARMLLLGLAPKLVKVSLDRRAIATTIRSLVRALGRITKLCCACAPCQRCFFALLEAVDEPIMMKHKKAWLCAGHIMPAALPADCWSFWQKIACSRNGTPCLILLVKCPAMQSVGRIGHQMTLYDSHINSRADLLLPYCHNMQSTVC